MALESPELQLALARIQFPAVIEELLSVLHLVNDDPCNLVSLISQREAVVFWGESHFVGDMFSACHAALSGY